MAEVKVLVEGYAREEGDAEFASSTVVLIQEEDKNIIVDPGMDREKLMEALKKENLTTKDIRYVILTHLHPDHILLAGIFENAEFIANGSIHDFKGKIVEHEGSVPGTDIELLDTPGHDPCQVSVVVETGEGIVVIASDLFWWYISQEQKTDEQSLMSLEDPYADSIEQLAESRATVLEMADFIIPGHGKMFKVE